MFVTRFFLLCLRLMAESRTVGLGGTAIEESRGVCATSVNSRVQRGAHVPSVIITTIIVYVHIVHMIIMTIYI